MPFNGKLRELPNVSVLSPGTVFHQSSFGEEKEENAQDG